MPPDHTNKLSLLESVGDFERSELNFLSFGCGENHLQPKLLYSFVSISLVHIVDYLLQKNPSRVLVSFFQYPPFTCFRLVEQNYYASILCSYSLQSKGNLVRMQ